VIAQRFSLRDASGPPTLGAVSTAAARAGSLSTPIQARLPLLFEVLGGQSETARVLGVAKSQPSRWMAGTDRPGPVAERAVLALDYVIQRLRGHLTTEQIRLWLTSAEPLLAGARPIDVIAARGALVAEPAVEAIVWGLPV
jgi:hypothetical protein